MYTVSCHVTLKTSVTNLHVRLDYLVLWNCLVGGSGAETSSVSRNTIIQKQQELSTHARLGKPGDGVYWPQVLWAAK